MKDRRQRTLEAYSDGRLSPRKRTRVQQWLVDDEESRRYVKRTSVLGSMVRESWSDGPPAPSADRLIAAIRPAMRQIDRVRAERSSWETLRLRLRVWFRGGDDLSFEEGLGSSEAARDPRGESSWSVVSSSWSGVSVWEWASGLSVATASVCAAVLLSGSGGEVQYEAQHLVAMPTQTSFIGNLGWADTVYDYEVADGDTPVMVYEGDAATVIYVGEDPEPEDLSLRISAEDWA